MEIIQIVGFGLLATILITIIKGTRPDMATNVSIVAGIAIFGFLLVRIGTVFRVLTDLATASGIEWVYLKSVLKVVGVAYVAGFGAQVCRDAGEGAIAQKLELAGKVIIMVIAVPIIVAVIDVVTKLLLYR